MTTEVKQILDELKAVREELDYIKENMIDKEMFLSLEEKKLLRESFQNEKEGKLVSGRQLRKHLGL